MENKINIATFSDSFYPIIGGRENVIHSLMKEFNLISNCFLATTTFHGHTSVIEDSSLPYEIIRCKSIRITKNEYLSIINKKFKNIIEQKIKNGEIDVIHCHTKYALLKYAFKLRKKYGIPVVTTVHTNYFEQYKNQLKLPLIYNIFLRHVKKMINKTDAVITVSKTMQTQLIKWGIDKNILVIPNGTDLTNPINLDELKNNIKIKYNISNNKNILLFVGRLVETKNITFLLKSIKTLKDNKLNFKIILVGGGEIKKYINLAKSLEIEDNCIFTNTVTNRAELAAFYSLADINLCPSKIETFGLTIGEAAAMKTPSITIEGCATSEDILNSFNGFISKDNIFEFSRTISEALKNKEKLKTIGLNAKNTLVKNWKTIAENHIELYKSIK